MEVSNIPNDPSRYYQYRPNLSTNEPTRVSQHPSQNTHQPSHSSSTNIDQFHFQVRNLTPILTPTNLPQSQPPNSNFHLPDQISPRQSSQPDSTTSHLRSNHSSHPPLPQPSSQSNVTITSQSHPPNQPFQTQNAHRSQQFLSDLFELQSTIQHLNDSLQLHSLNANFNNSITLTNQTPNTTFNTTTHPLPPRPSHPPYDHHPATQPTLSINQPSPLIMNLSTISPLIHPPNHQSQLTHSHPSTLSTTYTPDQQFTHQTHPNYHSHPHQPSNQQHSHHTFSNQQTHPINSSIPQSYPNSPPTHPSLNQFAPTHPSLSPHLDLNHSTQFTHLTQTHSDFDQFDRNQLISLLSTYQSTLKQTQQQFIDISKATQTIKTENTVFRSKLQKYKTHISDRDNYISQLEKTVTELRHQSQVKKTSFEALTAEVNQLRIEKDVLTKQDGYFREYIAHLLRKQWELQEGIEKTEAQCDKIAQNVNSALGERLQAAKMTTNIALELNFDQYPISNSLSTTNNFDRNQHSSSTTSSQTPPTSSPHDSPLPNFPSHHYSDPSVIKLVQYAAQLEKTLISLYSHPTIQNLLFTLPQSPQIQPPDDENDDKTSDTFANPPQDDLLYLHHKSQLHSLLFHTSPRFQPSPTSSLLDKHKQKLQHEQHPKLTRFDTLQLLSSLSTLLTLRVESQSAASQQTYKVINKYKQVISQQSDLLTEMSSHHASLQSLIYILYLFLKQGQQFVRQRNLMGIATPLQPSTNHHNSHPQNPNYPHLHAASMPFSPTTTPTISTLNTSVILSPTFFQHASSSQSSSISPNPTRSSTSIVSPHSHHALKTTNAHPPQSQNRPNFVDFDSALPLFSSTQPLSRQLHKLLVRLTTPSNSTFNPTLPQNQPNTHQPHHLPPSHSSDPDPDQVDDVAIRRAYNAHLVSIMSNESAKSIYDIIFGLLLLSEQLSLTFYPPINTIPAADTSTHLDKSSTPPNNTTSTTPTTNTPPPVLATPNTIDTYKSTLSRLTLELDQIKSKFAQQQHALTSQRDDLLSQFELVEKQQHYINLLEQRQSEQKKLGSGDATEAGIPVKSPQSSEQTKHAPPVSQSRTNNPNNSKHWHKSSHLNASSKHPHQQHSDTELDFHHASVSSDYDGYDDYHQRNGNRQGFSDDLSDDSLLASNESTSRRHHCNHDVHNEPHSNHNHHHNHNHGRRANTHSTPVSSNPDNHKSSRSTTTTTATTTSTDILKSPPTISDQSNLSALFPTGFANGFTQQQLHTGQSSSLQQNQGLQSALQPTPTTNSSTTAIHLDFNPDHFRVHTSPNHSQHRNQPQQLHQQQQQPQHHNLFTIKHQEQHLDTSFLSASSPSTTPLTDANAPIDTTNTVLNFTTIHPSSLHQKAQLQRERLKMLKQSLTQTYERLETPTNLTQDKHDGFRTASSHFDANSTGTKAQLVSFQFEANANSNSSTL